MHHTRTFESCFTDFNVSDVGKKSPTHLSVKEDVVEKQQRKEHLKASEAGASHEEGELSPKNTVRLNNGHDTDSKLDTAPKRRSYSDDLNKSRCLFIYFCF